MLNRLRHPKFMLATRTLRPTSKVPNEVLINGLAIDDPHRGPHRGAHRGPHRGPHRRLRIKVPIEVPTEFPIDVPTDAPIDLIINALIELPSDTLINTEVPTDDRGHHQHRGSRRRQNSRRRYWHCCQNPGSRRLSSLPAIRAAANRTSDFHMGRSSPSWPMSMCLPIEDANVIECVVCTAYTCLHENIGSTTMHLCKFKNIKNDPQT